MLEGEALRRLSTSLRGARIAVDAGHGTDDPGMVGPGGMTEADAGWLVAAALAQELARRGANPFLLRSRGTDPAEADRAHAANGAGAEVLVTVHMNSHREPGAEGATVFYAGHEGWFSPAGQRLAELIQDELVMRLGLKDGRTHPKWLPLLRQTRMPAVHVEPCFITNPREEELLGMDDFREAVASAIATGVERFFGARVGAGAAGAASTPASS